MTNPELVICHLDEGATLNIELTAETGKGGGRSPCAPHMGSPACAVSFDRRG